MTASGLPGARACEVLEYRPTRTRQDTQILMNSWRAIARSHRLLGRDIYRPKDGELRFASGTSVAVTPMPAVQRDIQRA
jgi:hypothetical protein